MRIQDETRFGTESREDTDEYNVAGVDGLVYKLKRFAPASGVSKSIKVFVKYKLVNYTDI